MFPPQPRVTRRFDTGHSPPAAESRGSAPSGGAFPAGTIADLLSRHLPAGNRRDGQCRISVVFSFWNEEQVLPELLRRVRSAFDLLLACDEIGGYELIFVNDASTDGSEDVLRAASRERDDIKLVNMSRNFGVSPCAMAGMHYASGDAVIYMDADLQDPPEMIPELIMRWKSDPEVEVVHTVRSARQGESRIKKCLTSLGYTLLRASSSIDLPREAGDFKLLSARVVRHLIQFQERKPFLRGLICFVGFKQDRVEYRREPRFEGESKFPVLGWKVISNFLDSALIAFSDLPLRLASACGLIAMFSSAVCLVALLGRWISASPGEMAGSGWLAAIAVSLLVGGIQLISLGVLGRYLASNYFEHKRRPNFIVKDTHGFQALVNQGKETPLCLQLEE